MDDVTAREAAQATLNAIHAAVTEGDRGIVRALIKEPAILVDYQNNFFYQNTGDSERS